MASSALNVFITGSNAGLGFETIKALVASTDKPGYHIFLGSRSVEKGEAAVASLQDALSKSNSKVETIQIDIEDDASIQKAFETIKSKVNHLDVLVNNAGAQFDHQFNTGKMGMREMWNANYNTNVSSTNIVTQTFMPLLFSSSYPSPRIIFVSSGTASLEEASQGLPKTAGTPPSGWPKPPTFSFTSYRSSKTAVTMLMLEWKRILDKDPIKLFALSPGFLATGLGGVGSEKLKQMGALDPTIGANFMKDVIDGKRDEDHGKTVRKDGIMPW